MGKRLYNLQPIKYWYCYDVEDICNMYKLHPQTVRKWQKTGLKAIDNKKPSLIYGYDLKNFLGKQNKLNKCKTKFNEFFCVKCKEAKIPYKKQISIEYVNGFMRVKGVCPVCKNIINKNYKLDSLGELKRIFNVVDVLELYDPQSSTTNTHILSDKKTTKSEPEQLELF